MIKILHITPNFNYNCGRSKLVYLYLKYLSNTTNYETHFITNGGDSLDRLKELPNVKYELINFATGYKNLLHSRNFYQKLKKYIIKNEIDLIHTHHRFPEFISVKIAKEYKIKTITSAHSYVNGFKRLSFKSDKIICVSNSIRDYLTNTYKISNKKSITIYNPVYQFQHSYVESVLEFKKEYNLTTDQKVLLFAGRITKDKGYDTLLKSFELIKSKIKNVVLILIGQKDIEKKGFKTSVVNEKLIYLPPVKDISYLYSIADIILLPSRIEPFGFVMIEAGSFKKPFIGGDTGGIAEFIEDGQNGLLVDPENPQELAEKIIYLINNPDVGKVLGENLYNKIDQLCDYNNYFTEVEKIYNSLLTSE